MNGIIGIIREYFFFGSVLLGMICMYLTYLAMNMIWNFTQRWGNSVFKRQYDRHPHSIREVLAHPPTKRYLTQGSVAVLACMMLAIIQLQGCLYSFDRVGVEKRTADLDQSFKHAMIEITTDWESEVTRDFHNLTRVPPRKLTKAVCEAALAQSPEESYNSCAEYMSCDTLMRVYIQNSYKGTTMGSRKYFFICVGKLLDPPVVPPYEG